MTLQWVVVSSFLYAEVVVTLLLILPLLKPSLWKKIFNIHIFSAVQPVWSTTFYTLLVILIFLFLDSIRQMMKYSKPDHSVAAVTLDTKLDRLLRECKGQRNFYITGFALFLMLVIKRLVTMLSQYASLDANYQATLKQAQNANAELARRLENNKGDVAGTYSKEEYETLQKKLKKSQAEVDAIKKQAEGTNTEYDRLSSEYQKLQDKVETSQEQKKDK